MLDSSVILESVAAEVLAVAAALITTMWHLRDQRNVAVDPYATEIKGLGHPHRATVVAGPDR